MRKSADVTQTIGDRGWNGKIVEKRVPTHYSMLLIIYLSNMLKPPSEWSEDDILALPAEGRNLERKNAIMLDLRLAGASETKIRQEMAVQISAFANSDGGTIVYGVSDNGDIHLGGISRSVKGTQPTKDWIETIALTLTEPQVHGLRVHEVLSNGLSHSKISKDKAVYVVEVPASPDAPHQCIHDRKYYTREGSHSVPGSHAELRAIVNRSRVPLLKAEFKIKSIALPVQQEGRIAGKGTITLQVRVNNIGRAMASAASMETNIHEPDAAFTAWEQGTVAPRSITSPSQVVWKLLDVVHPEGDHRFWIEFAIPLMLAPIDSLWWRRWAEPLDHLFLSWILFADSAAPRRGRVCLVQDLDFECRARQAIESHRNRRLIEKYYGQNLP